MLFKLSKRSPLTWLYIAGAVLLVVAAGFWCYKVNTNPERVFWKTIERGLTSRGVTIEAEQAGSVATAKQNIRFSLGTPSLAHSVTTLSQQGTTVKSEVLGTPTVDYSRYLSVKTDQKKADGNPIDFSKVLNIWAKSDEGDGRFFTQALFGGSLPIGGMGVPIGNIPPDNRAALVKQIHNDNVYQVSFSKTKKARVHGRLQYTYDVSVQPVGYVALMKRFSQDIGLHGLDQLDPSQYAGQSAFRLQMVVDVMAQHVVSVTASSNGATQTYTDYDIPVQIAPPQKTISNAELQQRLSQLQ